MMKKILFIALITVVGNYSTAQIGTLKGLKNKANKVKSKAKSPVSTNSNVDSKELLKTRELENEAQEQIDLLNGYFSNDNIKNISSETIKGTVYQLSSKLSTIKNYYAETSTKLSAIEADYAKYKELANTEYKDREVAGEISTDLKYLSEKTDYFRNNGGSSSYMANYAEYTETKGKYDAQAIKDETTAGYIENIEEYFNNYIPNEFSKEVKENLLNQDYFKEESWMENPLRAIEKTGYAIDNVESYKPLSKQADWIDGITKLLKEHKTKVTDYRENGDFDAYKEKKRRERAAKVFPSKSVSNDASVISVVKKDHNVKVSGTIQKIIIITDWQVKKNDLGIPLDKYVMVEVVSKIDGECYLNTGKVFRTYEGGGTYGNKKLSFYFTSHLMNCSNY